MGTVEIMDNNLALNNKHWSDLMNEIVSNQQSLQQLRVSTDLSNFVHIADGLESGLYASHKSIEDITIFLNLAFGSLPPRKIFIYLSRILDKLTASNRRNFMIVCYIHQKVMNNDENWILERNSFVNIWLEKYTIYEVDNIIKISNKDCKINGFL